MFQFNLKGEIRTKSIKKAAKKIVEKYYAYLSDDFYHNKKVIPDFAKIQSKRVLNKVSRCVTHIVKLVHKGGTKRLYIKKTWRGQGEKRELFAKIKLFGWW